MRKLKNFFPYEHNSDVLLGLFSSCLLITILALTLMLHMNIYDGYSGNYYEIPYNHNLDTETIVKHEHI